MTRVLDWGGVRNIRDLGDLPTALSPTGSTIPGRVARGPRRELLPAAGWQAASAWGLRSIVDLRNPEETGRRPADPDAGPPAGVPVTSAPTEDQENPEFQARCMPILDSPEYWQHNIEILPGMVRGALEAIALSAPGVLVHCSAGRDRTGMISALLLANAGVPAEAIISDYAQSVRAMAGAGHHGGPTSDPQGQWRSETTEAWLETVTGHVRAFVDATEDNFGKLGVDDHTRQQLRALLTAPEPSPDLVRLRLDLSYDGTDFHGWATQPGQRTVQGELEQALSRIARIPVQVTVAGRTDAGVHARGQVCHLDLPAPVLATIPGRSDRTPAQALIARLAGLLPNDVVAHRASEVPAVFDARFGALRRRYRYRISDSPTSHNPLRRDVLRHRWPLDVDAMNRASQPLLGEHDFLSFCKPREGATTIRALETLTWERPGPGMADEGLVVATVGADAFCHHMVRSLVGTLLAVGEGRRGEDWPAQVLAARTRKSATRSSAGAAPVCPPHGLTLEHIEYPADEHLEQQARAARTRRVS
ncbi:tRNA pseudouridine(38-40) synthase TruA [Brachybacterium epidermidis]|uniref:tRNA pseudouridine(38-40) synthase TruA n=1 Tax=Brachybacterium epidermidis TaxID=2781983 RepID=UPI00398F5B1F